MFKRTYSLMKPISVLMSVFVVSAICAQSPNENPSPSPKKSAKRDTNQHTQTMTSEHGHKMTKESSSAHSGDAQKFVEKIKQNPSENRALMAAIKAKDKSQIEKLLRKAGLSGGGGHPIVGEVNGFCFQEYYDGRFFWVCAQGGYHNQDNPD